MTISAKVIAASVSASGVTAYTLELEYPRFIHAELMTHRVFSRNSASSRAIPIKTMNELIKSNPAMPIHWGRNQAGMQAKEELSGKALIAAQKVWENACNDAICHSDALSSLGAHKQIANRVTEPYQHMKVVLTSTEWNNWDWLRKHTDAQPEIHELANVVYDVRMSVYPIALRENEWHLPYVNVQYCGSDTGPDQEYYDENGKLITLEEALMISASCCAQTSYRKADGTLEKAETIFKRLVESEPCHASPIEHQLMSYNIDIVNKLKFNWPEGVTHIDKDLKLWSGNIRGFIQYRQLIPNNVRKG